MAAELAFGLKEFPNRYLQVGCVHTTETVPLKMARRLRFSPVQQNKIDPHATKLLIRQRLVTERTARKKIDTVYFFRRTRNKKKEEAQTPRPRSWRTTIISPITTGLVYPRSVARVVRWFATLWKKRRTRSWWAPLVSRSGAGVFLVALIGLGPFFAPSLFIFVPCGH